MRDGLVPKVKGIFADRRSRRRVSLVLTVVLLSAVGLGAIIWLSGPIWSRLGRRSDARREAWVQSLLPCGVTESAAREASEWMAAGSPLGAKRIEEMTKEGQVRMLREWTRVRVLQGDMFAQVTVLSGDHAGSTCYLPLRALQ